MSVTLADIRTARRRIAGGVVVTPCPESIPFSKITGARIFCKLDNRQRTGSFKERGGIEKGFVRDGRMTRFTVVISDRPGGLAALSGASFKDIEHDRVFSGPDLSAGNAVCTVETRDHAHIRALHRALRKNGFPLVVAQ